MSYYGLPARDAALVGPIIEGTDKTHAIDSVKARAAVQRTIPGGSSGTLRWESGKDYVFVDVLPSHVLVTHNQGGNSMQLEIVLEVLDALRGAGLHVYDPQQASWFFKPQAEL
jgi:hypothetical protein